jgi:hypothetical protein
MNRVIYFNILSSHCIFTIVSEPYLDLTINFLHILIIKAQLSSEDRTYAPFSVDSSGQASDCERGFTDERAEPRDWRRLSRAIRLGPVVDSVENDGELLGLAGPVSPRRRLCSRWLRLDRPG